MDTLKDVITAADVCKEAADYLDHNNLTSISHGSDLHKKLREFASVKEHTEPVQEKVCVAFQQVALGTNVCFWCGHSEEEH